MNQPTESPNYRTERLGYPKEWNMRCPICGHPVHFVYANAGKMVHCLIEDIYQIVNLYRCENEECEFFKIAFNPTPRFDYGNRSWGVDVLKYIAKEFLHHHSTAPDILKRLSDEHPQLSISEDSINRICDDLLEMKAFRIDERTKDLILAQQFILLGFDAQDPGSDGDGLWVFTDMISGRILATTYFESVTHVILHEYIEKILFYFPVPVVGWVSDKQNVITKCHDTYYAIIPHQYCQFHFLAHLWDHLECLDSNVFISLKETIAHLYIHSSANSVEFEGKGKLSVKKVFKEMDKDLQAMIKVRNNTFKELRGVWLYEHLLGYTAGIQRTLVNMEPDLRVTKIMISTYEKLQSSLQKVSIYYRQTLELLQWFKGIKEILRESTQPWQEQQQRCEAIFQMVWEKCQKEDPRIILDECKAFLAHKTSAYAEILGEWCRLWNSYWPGLFQYQKMPGVFRTNNVLEHLFSLEKCTLVTRSGKPNVSHMIATRGEAYLRICHCDSKELAGDLTIEFQEELVKILRYQLKSRITKQTAKWRTRNRVYDGYIGISMSMEPYSEEMTKMEVR